jgi:hypothetical protein
MSSGVLADLRSAASKGEILDLRTGDPKLDDPRHQGVWPSTRIIPAADLIELLTESTSGTQPLRKVSVRGAKIEGQLDCEGLQLEYPLVLIDCYLEEQINLQEAEIPHLRLLGCLLGSGLNAHGAIFRSSLELRAGFESLDSIRLDRAQIGGHLNCSGARIFKPGGVAIAAYHAVVGNSVRLDDHFVVHGEVNLDGASIQGQLICNSGTFIHRDGEAISAHNATIKQGVFFRRGAKVRGAVRFLGSTIESTVTCEDSEFSNPTGISLSLDGASISGDVRLYQMVAKGGVRLVGAHVGGSLVIKHTRLHSPGGAALGADRAIIDDGAFLDEGFFSDGEVRLPGSKIGGILSCGGAEISNPNGEALVMDTARVSGEVFLSEGFTALGTVRFPNAEFNSLYCSGGKFFAPEKKAIYAVSLTVLGSMYCDVDFVAKGEIDISRASIGNQLNFNGATVEKVDGVAILGDGLTASSVHLSGEFTARGTVRFQSADVGRAFNCSGGKFISVDLPAMVLDGLSVGSVVSLSSEFEARGEVRMIGAHVRGQIVCTNGVFVNRQNDALVFDSTVVEDSLVCGDRFSCTGTYRMCGADVKGQVVLGGSFNGDDAPMGAILVSGATIGRELYLVPAKPVRGRVSLANATVGHLRDGNLSWSGKYDLTGFAYGTFAGPRDAPTRNHWWQRDSAVRSRITWLEGSEVAYRPDIYEQLAGCYARNGDGYRQKLVLIAGLRRRRPLLGLPGRLWSFIEDWLFGFGYRPWRILLPFAALVVLGVLFFNSHSGDMTPVDPEMNHPTFHALPYTLELLVPVIDLGQRSSWIPTDRIQDVTLVFVVLGWALSAAILTLVTSLLRRGS